MSKPNRTTKHWRIFFSSKQLETAKNFIKKGKYSGLNFGTDSAYGIIGDSSNYYQPSIERAPTRYSTNWDPANFYCTCSAANPRTDWFGFSAPKKTCAHEAALLMLWEAEHGAWVFEETDKEREVRLQEEAYERKMTKLKRLKDSQEKIEKPASQWKFAPKTIEDTVYFDIPAITARERTSLYALNRAKEYEDKAKFTSGPSINYDVDGRQSLSFSALIDDEYERATVDMTIGADSLLKHSCGCKFTGFSSYYRFGPDKLCGHELAALSLVWEYVNEHNPGDATDRAADKLFKEWDRRVEKQTPDEDNEIVEKKKDVTIKPHLILSEGRLTLNFRIGNNNKLMLLKNYRNLQSSLDEEKTFSLGKTLTIDFAKEDVTDESRQWLNYIFGRIGDADRLNNRIASSRYGYYTKGVSVQSTEVLSGAALDQFYDLAIDKDIDCDYKDEGRKGLIHIGDVKPKIKLECKTMKDSSGAISGVKVKGYRPTVINGTREKYVAAKGRFGILSKDEWDAFSLFDSATASDGSIVMHIGKNKLADFYYRIVPDFIDNPYIDFEDKGGEQVEKILPPEPEFSFRLDIVDDNCTAECDVSYGDKKYVVSKNRNLSRDEYHDIAQEHRVISSLVKYFPNADNQNNCWTSPYTDENFYKIVTEGVHELNRYGEVKGTEFFNTHPLRKTPKISFNVSVDSGLMDIEVLSKDLSPQELLDIYKNYKLKKKFYKLKDGSFVELNSNMNFDSIESIADKMNIDVADLIGKKIEVPTFRALYLDKLMEEHEELVGNRDRNFRQLIKSFRTIRDADYDVPSEMEDTLRNYQVYGHKWMRTVTENGFGGILADEMGLGKTLETISVISTFAKREDYRGTLVVCPASLVYNWEEEINRFAPELSVVTLTGTASVRKKILGELKSDKSAEIYDVYVTSYDLLRSDIDNYKDLRFSFMVIDEAQYIKNQKAAMTKAVKIINSDMRIALTGTPIENRLAELWSIFDFLMPGFLYDYKRFSEDFEVPITKRKDDDATLKLKNMVSPFILRRRKEDVLKDLPAKLEEVRYAKFDKKQREVYDAQVLKMKGLLADRADGDNDKIKILAELMHIRQICCDPSLMFENYKGESAKREACIELVKNAIGGGHRMLIFSQFTSMLELLEKDLIEEKIPYFKITGSTSKEKRLKYVHEFNEGDVPVFLISLKAGGTGLNLTGADMVIHYDPWWNVAAQNQATDRAHRIGQTKTVTVYKLIAKGTIEEKILEMQEAKKDLADAILSGEQKSLMSLTNDELMELLA